jgi:hypothetical protein
MLDEAIESVDTQIDFKVEELLIVYPTKIKTDIERHFLDKKTDVKITLKENEGNFKFQDQINLAAESVTTPYFSILEFDDVYSRVYFRSVEKYSKAYPNVDLLIPFVLEGTKNNNNVKIINDHVWSKSHMEDSEMGFLTIKSLQAYSVVNVTGGVFKTESYKRVGGLKRNIELTFWYEMLLRMCNNGMSVFILPKAGYRHMVNRDNSLFMIYNNTMNQKLKAFWFETANKEFYFTNDRVILQPETT